MTGIEEHRRARERTARRVVGLLWLALAVVGCEEKPRLEATPSGQSAAAEPDASSMSAIAEEESPLTVRVVARQWSWRFVYETGHVSPELVLPAEREIHLVMTSEDVIHSFFVAAFRVAAEAIPGRETEVELETVDPTEATIQCAEYCGERHSEMVAPLRVVSREDFDRWLVDR